MMNMRKESSRRVGLRQTPQTGVIVSGKFYKVGRLYGVAVSKANVKNQWEMDREGQWVFPVEAQGADIVQGSAIYWEAGRADSEFHNDGADAGGILIGTAVGIGNDVDFADETGLILAAGRVGQVLVALDGVVAPNPIA